jgi:hypothetical protein
MPTQYAQRLILIVPATKAHGGGGPGGSVR